MLLDSFLQTMLLLIEALTKTARDPIEMLDAGWAHEGDQVGVKAYRLTIVHSTSVQSRRDHDGHVQPAP